MIDADFIYNLASQQPRRRSLNEVKDYHPLVAKWLTENNYEYKHHYKLPDYGIADFLATHQDGHCLLVEAKCVRSKIKKAILQVRVYQLQLPEARAIVVTAPEFLRDDDFPMADKHDVKIVTVGLTDILKERIKVNRVKITICEGCKQPLYYHRHRDTGEITLSNVGEEIKQMENLEISLIPWGAKNG